MEKFILFANITNFWGNFFDYVLSFVIYTAFWFLYFVALFNYAKRKYKIEKEYFEDKLVYFILYTNIGIFVLLDFLTLNYIQKFGDELAVLLFVIKLTINVSLIFMITKKIINYFEIDFSKDFNSKKLIKFSALATAAYILGIFAVDLFFAFAHYVPIYKAVIF